MKIRNHRKLEWRLFPPEGSTLKKTCYKFKYKASLMRFINANIDDTINGLVVLHEDCFGSSHPFREWTVWYNERPYRRGANFKPELRQLTFRGSKYVFKKRNVSKADKRFFAMSDKVISLMCNIEQEDGTILPKDAKRLVKLFEKRGFKDFEPNEDEWRYINGHISDGLCFFHWSDRCNWLRTKTVIEYFKRNGLLD